MGDESREDQSQNRGKIEQTSAEETSGLQPSPPKNSEKRVITQMES